MSLQPLTGLASSYRAPITAAEILFNQGASTAAAGARTVLLSAPSGSGGSYTAGTVYRVTKESDVVSGTGTAGCPLHRMARKFLATNNGADLYVLPYAASSGAGVASATGTVTVTLSSGSNPTKAGILYVTVCGEDCAVSYSTSDTVTTIGDSLEAKINSLQHLPVTASNSGGVVTLTAKVAGASQGDGTTGVIRFRASVDSGTNVLVATSGAALGLGTGTAGADGATTELSNLTSALANIANSRFYYMAFSVWKATDVAAVLTHLQTKCNPNPGLRSVAIFAFTGALATAQTTATGKNYERLQYVNQRNSEHDSAELAAAVCGVRQKRESVDAAYNFDYYSEADWSILPVYSASDYYSSQDLDDAVTDGVTPIQSNATRSWIAMSVTTRSKDSTGAIDDFRSAETHRVSVLDEFVDTWLLRHNQTYRNFKLKADQLLADGVTVNPNQQRIPRVLTPSQYKLGEQLIDEFVAAGKLQDADAWKNSMRKNVDPSNSGRLEVGCSGRTIDLLHQTTIRIAETTPS